MQRPSCADVGPWVAQCIPGNLINFNRVNLFTTTKQNPTTQHALGQRSAEIHKDPLAEDTDCFSQDRNLNTGFIGIGQYSGLRTLFTLNTQPFALSISRFLNEEVFCTDARISKQNSFCSTSLQNPDKPCLSFRELVFNDNSYGPAITGACKFPGLYPFL